MVENHIGGYSDFHEAKLRRSAAAAPKKETVKPSPSAGSERKNDRAASSKMAYTLQHELSQLPDKISALEAEIARLNEALLEPELYTKDPARFDEATKRIAKAQKELEKAEMRWLELEDMRQQTEA